MWRPIARPINSPVSTNVGGGLVVSGLPIANRFVSSSATNGYALGSNANNGLTKQTPWLTVDFAIANATTGDVIQVNDGTYTSATFFNPTGKTLTIQARILGVVILRAAVGQTRIVNINPGPSSQTVKLINIVLDGNANTTRGVTMSNPGPGITCGMYLRNCEIRAVTTSFFDSGAPDVAAIDIINLRCVGAISTRGVFASFKDGYVNINGVTLSGVSVSTPAAEAAIQVLRATGGVGTATASIRGVTGTYTGPAGQTFHGIIATSFDNAVIDANNITLQGGAGSLGALYMVRSNSGALTANGCVVRGNYGHNGLDAGYGVLIGTDSTSVGDNRHNNPLVENNNLTANQASAQPIHGYMLGWGSGGTVRNNVINGAAHALIAKDWTGGEFSDNTVSGFAFEGMYAKGATGTAFRRNTLNVTALSSQAIVKANFDDVSGTFSTGIIFDANVINYNIGPSVIVLVEASNTATFTENTYNVNAALPATAWNYQGTGYATLSAWKAAVEPTAHP